MRISILNTKLFWLLLLFVLLPAIMIIVLAFFYNDGVSPGFSLLGFEELLRGNRIREISEISKRALIVSIISTITAFIISYIIVLKTTSKFQLFFLVAITLPFLVNEVVRVFSWRYMLAENGWVNRIISNLTGHHMTFFNASNHWNIYFVMILSCLPFAIFICVSAIKTLPGIYWKAREDLKIRELYSIITIVVPLTKIPLWVSGIVTFFFAFSLSSEVNLLGGDTKLSIRNLVLSFMSSGRFQAIFSLGFIIILTVVALSLIYNFIIKPILR